MTLLAPLLLLGGILLAVPLLLHLWHRREVETEAFPALRYLMASTRDRDRTLRLRQLLLLLLRMAVLALLVLAAARLVLPLGGRDHPPGSLVVVVDNGISSGLVLDGERALDRLVERGRGAVAATGPQDRIWVIPAGEPWRPAFPLTSAQADSLLAGLEPLPVRSRLDRALARADALLAAAGPGPSEILLLSDLRGFEPSMAGETTAPVAVVGVEPPRTPQRGIAEVRVGGGLVPRAGDPSEVEVRVAGADSAGVAVRLHLEAELAAAGRTDERGWVLLPLPPLEEGWRTGRVELDPDALRADDQSPFSLWIRPAPTVRPPASPPRFLAEALETLAAGGRIRTADAAAEVRIVFGEEVGGPFEEGLTVLLPPEDPAVLPAVNRWLEEIGSAWRMALEDREEGTEHRILADGHPWHAASLSQVAVRRRVLLEGPDRGIVLRTNDGRAWLVEEEAPGRRLRILASPLDQASSDLPLSAAMLPFMDRLLDPVRGGGDAPAVEAGDPIPLPAEVQRVRSPDGTLHPADGIPSVLDTSRPGIWDLLGEGDAVVARVAIRPAPPPGPPVPVEEVVQALGHTARAVREPPRWEREVLPDRRGREVAPLLGALALLLLIAEGWLAAQGRVADGKR